MAEIDWRGLMRAGIAGRGLLPRDFWALTPAELALILGVGEGAGDGRAAMGRAGLEALSALYPDDSER